MKKIILLLCILPFLGISQETNSVQKGFYRAVFNDTVLGNRTTERKAKDDGDNYAKKHKLSGYKILFPEYVDVKLKYSSDIEIDTVIIRDTIFKEIVIKEIDTIKIKDVELLVVNSFMSPVDVDNVPIYYNANGNSVGNWIEESTSKITRLGGNTYQHQTQLNKHSSIPNEMTDEEFNSVFSTENWNPNNNPLSYSLDVENGEYRVELYMGAEYFTTRLPGSRVYDIIIENETVFDSFDVNKEFGTLHGGMVYFDVEVVDQEINISFNNIVDHALINGLKIIRI